MSQLPDELRHAYRALLRAATYLPDSAARTYIHNYTVSRFRDVAKRIRSAKGEEAERLVARYHSKDRVRKVWQASRQLERAGQGSAADLRTVFYLTYGRSGKRRRELVQQLLERDEAELPVDQAALEALIQKRSEEVDNELHRHKDNLQLKALVRSQKFHQPLGTRITKLKSLSPVIPESNIWGRPLPLKLQASIKRKYWADTLERLLPPLPLYEWIRLRDLASGAVPLDHPPKRRSKPAQGAPDTAILEYFTTPTNRHTSEFEAIELGEDDIPTSLEKKRHTKGINTMTPRFMRRLYAMIWSMTPTMSQDEATKIWTTKWGGSRSAALTGQVTAPSAIDVELFDGADESVKPDGKLSGTERRDSRRTKKMLAGHRAEHKVLLGTDGYTQGVVPAI